MIFLTVGAQMPFDRLIKTVDKWAQDHSEKIYAQIGNTEYEPDNFTKWIHHLDVSEFTERMKTCDLVIAHAGMGSIISAMSLNKPILVLPRRGHLMETRNDHQLDTAKSLAHKINVAYDEVELLEKLNKLDELIKGNHCGNHAEDRLINALSDFINS